MRAQHIESDRFARPRFTFPILQQMPDRNEITERLRHLLALDLQVARVKPHARKMRPPARAAALRDLALVVGCRNEARIGDRLCHRP